MRIDTSCIAGTTVAFQAKLKNPISSLSPNQIIKYDDVITNIGEGYDRTTGKFTALMDGVYSFTWTYMTKKGARVYDQTATLASATDHLIVTMERGTRFWTSNTKIFNIYSQPLYFPELIQNFSRMIFF